MCFDQGMLKSTIQIWHSSLCNMSFLHFKRKIHILCLILMMPCGLQVANKHNGKSDS
jgi:hypothetical protein